MWRTSSPSSPSSGRSSAKPTIAASGVRSSWLARESRCCRAAMPARASSRAASSSRSAALSPLTSLNSATNPSLGLRSSASGVARARRSTAVPSGRVTVSSNGPGCPSTNRRQTSTMAAWSVGWTNDRPCSPMTAAGSWPNILARASFTQAAVPSGLPTTSPEVSRCATLVRRRCRRSRRSAIDHATAPTAAISASSTYEDGLCHSWCAVRCGAGTTTAAAARSATSRAGRTKAARRGAATTHATTTDASSSPTQSRTAIATIHTQASARIRARARPARICGRASNGMGCAPARRLVTARSSRSHRRRDATHNSST